LAATYTNRDYTGGAKTARKLSQYITGYCSEAFEVYCDL